MGRGRGQQIARPDVNTPQARPQRRVRPPLAGVQPQSSRDVRPLHRPLLQRDEGQNALGRQGKRDDAPRAETSKPPSIEIRMTPAPVPSDSLPMPAEERPFEVVTKLIARRTR